MSRKFFQRQMYILSTPLACSLCGGDSTVGDIGDHLAQVHIGAADSDWHCSNGCHYRTTSRADIASHCLITRHAASKITKPLIFAELLSEVQQRFMSALSCAQEHTTSTQSNECIPVPDVDVLNAPQSHSEVTKLVEEESFNLPEPRVLSVINAEADLFLGTSLDQLHVTYQVPEKIKDYRNEITPSDVENSDNEEEPSESEAEIESPMSPEQERLKQTEDEEIRNLVTALGDIRKKPLSCSHCSYTTNSKNNLVVHIRTHTGDRPFKCMICTYAASKSSDLNRHKLKHTEDRPYKCSQCPYRATQKTDFNTHFRTHTGERPFQCDICPYAATEKEQLKRHLLLHTGERPFKCNDCPYSCTQKLHLIKHVRTHAGKKGYTDGQRIGSL